MPKGLTAAERKIWRRRVSELAQVPGLLKVIDGAALRVLVNLEAAYEENERELAKSGQLYKRPTGEIVTSPRVKLKQELAQQLLQYYREFGWTPSSRSRIQVPEAANPSSRLANMVLKTA